MTARLRRTAQLAAMLAGLTLTPLSQPATETAPFEGLYREAHERRLRELGPRHPATIASRTRLAALLRTHGRASEAESILREALESGSESEWLDGATLFELGETLSVLGRNAEAESFYQRSLDVAGPGAESAKVLLRLAALREARGAAADALQAYLEALEHFSDAGHLTDSQREARAAAWNGLGLLYEAQGDFSDAAAMYRQSSDAHAQIFGEEHPATAAARANWADMLALEGNLAEAVSLLEGAVETVQAAFGRRHEDTVRLRDRLGELYEVLGRWPEAEAQYLAALSGLEEASPLRGLALADLGRLKGLQGNLAAADRTLAEAVAILETQSAGMEAELGEALHSRGSVLRDAGRLAEAERALRRALELRERALGSSHAEVAQTMVGLAGSLHLRGDIEAAEPLYRQAIAIQERGLGAGHPDVGETLYNLGHLELARGDRAAAKVSFERAAAILSGAYGAGDPFVASIREALRSLR